MRKGLLQTSGLGVFFFKQYQKPNAIVTKMKLKEQHGVFTLLAFIRTKVVDRWGKKRWMDEEGREGWLEGSPSSTIPRGSQTNGGERIRPG